MNKESILNQFDIVEKSMERAKLIFETDMIHENTIKVSLYELMKSMKQIENIILEIAPDTKLTALESLGEEGGLNCKAKLIKSYNGYCAQCIAGLNKP